MLCYLSSSERKAWKIQSWPELHDAGVVLHQLPVSRKSRNFSGVFWVTIRFHLEDYVFYER